jgi:ADP-ribose pyrophosphatase
MHSDKSMQQAMREKDARIESEEVYRGRPFSVRRDTYQLENGEQKRWDIIVHSGAVVLVPVTKKGELLLVKQWRRAAGKILLELPAGTLEPGEEPAVCAQRELREETGYRADKIIPLGGFFSAPGFCTEYLHLFLALDLTEAPLESEDSDEAIDLVSATFEQVEQMIETHQIQDAKTIAGFYRYTAYR